MKTYDPITVNIMGLVIAISRRSGYTEKQWEDLRQKWSRCAVKSKPDVQMKIGFSKVMPKSYAKRPPENKDLWSSTRRQLEESLSSHLTLQGIEHNKGEKIMMHSCGFSDSHGNVIALVASSGTGKTTLARTLGPHFGYVSDETVVIEFDGTVRPYPKPLSVIVDKTKPKEQIGADELGLQKPVSGKLTLKKIILLNRDKTPKDAHAPATVEDVALADAIIALTPEMSHMAAVDKPLQRISRLIQSVGGVVRFNYVEAKTLLPLLEAEFAS